MIFSILTDIGEIVNGFSEIYRKFFIVREKNEPAVDFGRVRFP